MSHGRAEHITRACYLAWQTSEWRAGRQASAWDEGDPTQKSFISHTVRFLEALPIEQIKEPRAGELVFLSWKRHLENSGGEKLTTCWKDHPTNARRPFEVIAKAYLDERRVHGDPTP